MKKRTQATGVRRQELNIAALAVPCRQRGQATAYLLGVHHGATKAKPWDYQKKFCYDATRTAYALGLAAGLAWRAMQKGATK